MTHRGVAAESRPLYSTAGFEIDESIGFLLKRVRAMLCAAVDREIAEHDVTYEQWGVLVMILKGRGDTAAELARETECDTGSMTRMIDRLEAKDLLRRSRSSEDRRVVRLELTPSGKRLAERLVAAIVNVMNRHLHGFSAGELQQMKDFLRRMLANRAQ